MLYWLNSYQSRIGIQRLSKYLLVSRVLHRVQDTNGSQIVIFYNFITRFKFHSLPMVRHHQCASRNLEVWLTKCILTSGGFYASFLGESPKRKEMAMKTQYRTVHVNTLEGLKEAEKLKRLGWSIGSVGLTTIQFYRRYNVRNNI